MNRERFSFVSRKWDYPFRPVVEIPSMKVRCARKKTMMTGAAIIVLTAIKCFAHGKGLDSHC
jgi:hypothetical protein